MNDTDMQSSLNKLTFLIVIGMFAEAMKKIERLSRDMDDLTDDKINELAVDALQFMNDALELVTV